MAAEEKDKSAAKHLTQEASVAKEDLDKAESKLEQKLHKSQVAASKVVKAQAEIAVTKEEIKAKVADDKEVKRNELSADGKLKTYTRDKP